MTISGLASSLPGVPAYFKIKNSLVEHTVEEFDVRIEARKVLKCGSLSSTYM